jgi:hypothetical protein
MTPRGTVVAEDVRDLQRWTAHVGRLRGVSSRTLAARRAQAIERALDLGDHPGRNAGVAGRRLQLLVSERARVTLITFLRY